MTARKILGTIWPKYKTPSVCESCGGEFACGASLSGCWCASIELTDEIREKLRSRFKGCLCRDCLSKLAREKKLDLNM